MLFTEYTYNKWSAIQLLTTGLKQKYEALYIVYNVYILNLLTSINVS